MQKIFFVVILFFLSSNLYAQKSPFRCYITVSLNDCVNCLNASKVLLDIPKEFQPTLVFKSQHKKQAPKIISDVMKITWSQENVIVSDSLFNILVPESTPYSEIHITDKNNFKFFTCLLTNLHQDKNLDKIKSLVQIKGYDTQKVLPDSIIISNSLNLKYKEGNQYIFAQDYLFNKIYIFDKKDKKLHATIDGKHLDRQDIYKAYFGDTTKYYERITSKQKKLEEAGKTEVRFFNFIDDKKGNIYLWLAMYYAIDSLENKMTYVMAKTMFLKYQKNGKYTYFNIDKARTSKDFIKEKYYGFGSQWDIYKENEKLYVMPAKENPDSTTSILAEISLESNNKDKEIFKLKKAYYPSVFNGTDYLFLSYNILPPYIFLGHYPEFINFETGKKAKIMLEYEDKDFKNLSINNRPYQLIGVIEKDGVFYALINQKDDLFYVSIDKNGQILSKQYLYLPDKNISAFIFIDKNQLIAINNENDLITISLQ